MAIKGNSLEENLFKEEQSRQALADLSDRLDRMGKLRNEGYTQERIGRFFGISSVRVSNLLNQDKYDALQRRKSPHRILTRLGIGIYDELTENAINYIKARPWSSRKRIAYELYLRGYALEEIGEIIGTAKDPYKPAYKAEINTFLKTTEYDRRLHEQRRVERQHRNRLNESFQNFGINRQEFEKAIRPYSPMRKHSTIAKFTGYPRELVTLYVRLDPTTSKKRERLIRLRRLYREGRDISPSGMLENSETHTLLSRIVEDWGSYKRALRYIGVRPNLVYRSL